MKSITLLLPQQPGSEDAESAGTNRLLLGINAASLESLELHRFVPGGNLATELHGGQYRHFQGVGPSAGRVLALVHRAKTMRAMLNRHQWLVR